METNNKRKAFNEVSELGVKYILDVGKIAKEYNLSADRLIIASFCAIAKVVNPDIAAKIGAKMVADAIPEPGEEMRDK